MAEDDGSSAPEAWIDLPAYIDTPLEVYVNGIVQQQKDGRLLVASGLRPR